MPNTNPTLLYPLPEKTYTHLTQTLYSPLLYGENSVVLCPGLYGKDHNVRFIRERDQDRRTILGLQHQRFNFANLDLLRSKGDQSIWINQFCSSLGLGQANTYQSLVPMLEKLIQDGEELVFFVNLPETLTTEEFTDFLELAQRIYYIAPSRIHFLLILDNIWDEADFYRIITPYRSLFQNIREMSLYSDDEMSHFIRYWSQRWQQPVNQRTLEFLVDLSGGILLLAKAGFRVISREKITTYKKAAHIVPTHPDFTVQLKLYISRLTQTQQTILENLSNYKRVENESEQNHMTDQGILELKSNRPSVRSKAVRSYFEKPIKTRAALIKIINQSSQLSDREKLILKYFVNNQGILISRDQLGDIIWKDQPDDYSEWAIDQTVSRIRKKITNHQKLKLLNITTHKKQGFSLE